MGEDRMSLMYRLSKIKEQEDQIVAELKYRREQLEGQMASLEEMEIFANYDQEMVAAWVRHPYHIMPRYGYPDDRLMVVARFFGIQVGYLLHSTDTHNVFVVNKYAKMLGEMPKEMERMFNFKPELPLRMFDGMVLTGEKHQDAAWERYKGHLHRREGTDKIRVKKGHEFDLVAAMIEDGINPWMRKPVDDEHLIEGVWHWDGVEQNVIDNAVSRMEMPFFREAVQEFFDWGRVGIFWATGVGKTLYGLEILSRVKVEGRVNVVISGMSSALQYQWEQRLKSIDPAAETIVIPFQSWHKVKDLKIGVLIVDECQHLPAKTFKPISISDYEYLVGLSATPYRESQDSELIFALTGKAIGLNWRVLVELGLIKEPTIQLFLCDDVNQKIGKLKELMQYPDKTLVYCHGITLGKRLSKELGIAYVHGATPVPERLEIVKNSHQVIVSKAMGEGISVRDIERTITFDFHFGSRQEELQFFGRLLHGEDEGRHVILMTYEEYEKYGKRLYGIEEKGFKIPPPIRVGIGKKSGGGRSRRVSTPKVTKEVKVKTVEERKVEYREATAPFQGPIKMRTPASFPFLDERDPFTSGMILTILKSDYAKSKGGLLVSEMKEVIDHWHVKYRNYDQINNAVKYYYGKREIAARREGNSRRYFIVE